MVILILILTLTLSAAFIVGLLVGAYSVDGYRVKELSGFYVWEQTRGTVFPDATMRDLRHDGLTLAKHYIDQKRMNSW